MKPTSSKCKEMIDQVERIRCNLYVFKTNALTVFSKKILKSNDHLM